MSKKNGSEAKRRRESDRALDRLRKEVLTPVQPPTPLPKQQTVKTGGKT